MSKVRLLAALAAGAFVLGACEEADTTEDEVTEAEETTADEPEETEEVEETDEAEEPAEEEEAAEDELLSIGDSFTADDVTVTITDAYYTDERNEFEETDPENVLAIEYTLENNADEDYPVGMDFQVYVDGSLADTYANENTMDSVSSGRSIEAISHYGVSGDQIEAEWEPFFSFSGEKGIWDVSQ